MIYIAQYDISSRIYFLNLSTAAYHPSSPEASFLSCSFLQYYGDAMPNAKIRKKKCTT